MNTPSPIKCLRLASAHSATALKHYTKSELAAAMRQVGLPPRGTKQQMLDALIDSHAHLCFFITVKRKPHHHPTVD